MTPSSAATTITATSVTFAPRARIAVKASWPGVSRKVIVLLVVVDLVGADVLGDAAGLAGGDLGLADRVEQRGLAVVDVAHDRDDRRAVGEIVVGVVERGLLVDLFVGVVTISILRSNLSAIASIVSSESVCVRVAISPVCIRLLITSALLTPRVSATSRTVAPELTLVACWLVRLERLGSTGSSKTGRRRRPRRRGGR